MIEPALARVSLRMHLRKMRFDPFADLTRDPVKAARAEKFFPAPTSTYGILFTPRSGSSRAVDLLESTRMFGQPGEVFNPEFIRGIAGAYNCDTVETYADAVLRRRASGPVSGFKATFEHLYLVFGDMARFDRLMAPDRLVWLIREDIVAQAVSISRMIQTRVAHNTGLSAADITRDDSRFDYRPDLIRKQVATLRWCERKTEAWLRQDDRPLLRMSYERLASAVEVVTLFARFLDVSVPPDRRPATTHKKLGTDRNIAYADRFREENPRLMARIAAERATMLARLDHKVEDAGAGDARRDG